VLNATQQVMTNVQAEPQFNAAFQLYNYFQNPQLLADQCRGYYSQALLMLLVFGLAFRVLALGVLCLRVYVRKPRVRRALRWCCC
jgi:hypothetical protein